MSQHVALSSWSVATPLLRLFLSDASHGALPVAEGLRDNWKKGAKSIKDVLPRNSHDIIGGLQDEDALSARPI